MTIIGNAGRDTLLVKMSRDEFAQIGGFNDDYGVSNAKYEHRDAYFVPGRELKVSEIYSRIRHQESVSERLADAAKNLRALADLVEYASPAAEELTKQPEGGAK